MRNLTVFKHLVLFYVTGAYFGFIPKAPGTFGTLVGVFIFILIGGNTLSYFIVTGAIVVSGTYFSDIAEKEIFKVKDSPEIVIDEIAGYLITMAFFDISDSWIYILVGFLLFRFFDIIKPFPINKLQGFKGGWGIMLDDLLAGLISGLLLHLMKFVMFE